LSVEKLVNWTLVQLNVQCEEQYQWSTVSGDASFRHYYRLTIHEQSYVVVMSPPDKEKNHEFVTIAKALRAAGVLVPEIIAVDFDQGFIIQQDFGDQLLLPLLNSDNIEHYYSQAMDLMLAIAQSGVGNLPTYDSGLLGGEFALFAQWFVGEAMDYQLDVGEQELLSELEQCLTDSALQQPQVVVHRDFHARNIMYYHDRLAAIDFQDAVIGPVSYDLVSLLKDCYIRWPRQQVITWVEDYRIRYESISGETYNPEQWLRWFDLMGLQRHMKVLGIFSRLHLRDGKAAYLNDLPRVIDYIEEVVVLYPELAAFSQWFRDKMRPLFIAQPWWRS